jgi:hypothetical protein
MSDDKILPLFDQNRKPSEPKKDPVSVAQDWEIVLNSGELIKVNGHIVLNGMMVAILENPDDSFSLKFYANVEAVEYVKRA